MVTEPFAGSSNDSVQGLFINPDGEIVAWGPYQRGSDATFARGTAFWHTPDGAHWDVSRLGGADGEVRVLAVSTGPDGFVALSGDGIAGAWHSLDGLDWKRSAITPEPRLEFEYLNAVAEGTQGLLAVGSTGGERSRMAGWWSATGHEWTQIDTDLPEGWFKDVVATPDGFVAVGVDYSRSGTHEAIWRVSPDGLDWERAARLSTTSGPGMDDILDVRYFAGGLVAFGMHAEPGEEISCHGCYWDPELQAVYTSLDGVSWQRHVAEGLGLMTPAMPWYGAVQPWQDGLIGVGRDTGNVVRVWTSPDGVRWQETGAQLGTASEAEYFDVHVANNRIVLGGIGEDGGIVAIGVTLP